MSDIDVAGHQVAHPDHVVVMRRHDLGERNLVAAHRGRDDAGDQLALRDGAHAVQMPGGAKLMHRECDSSPPQRLVDVELRQEPEIVADRLEQFLVVMDRPGAHVDAQPLAVHERLVPIEHFDD